MGCLKLVYLSWFLCELQMVTATKAESDLHGDLVRFAFASAWEADAGKVPDSS